MTGVARRRAGRAGAMVLALAAAAVLGVALGRSAIGEINPVHFQDPAPLRAVQPDTAPPPQDSFAQAYGWDAGAAARAADCGGDCDRREARDAAGFGLDEPPPPAERRAALAEPAPWPPGAVDDGNGPAEQYAHYPIEAKPADPPAPAAAPAVPDEDPGDGN